MKLSELFITEARAHQAINPKTSINDILINASDQTTDTVTGVTKNLFVSFTEVDKLGLNPRSPEKYSTPVGVYSYPIEYVVNTVGMDKSMSELPFAGTAPYVNIFKVSGNVIDVGQMTEQESRVYYKRMVGVISKSMATDERTSLASIRQFKQEAETTAKVKSVGGKFWYVSMMVAQQLTGVLGTHASAVWTRLFRSIGIDAVLDNGTGIVHENEPYQMVVFSTSLIYDNQRYLNKYSPDEGERAKRIEQGKQTHVDVKEVAAQLRKLTNKDDIAEYIINRYPRYIRLVIDQATRSYILTQAPDLIQFLPKRTDVDIHAAVTTDINTIVKVVDLDQSTAFTYISKYRNKLDPKYVFSILFKYEVMDERLQNLIVKLDPNVLQFAPNAFLSSIMIALNTIQPTPQWLRWMAEQHNIDYLKYVDDSEVKSEIAEIRDTIARYQRNYDSATTKVKNAQVELTALKDGKNAIRKKELKDIINQGIATFTNLWDGIEQNKRKLSELENFLDQRGE